MSTCTALPHVHGLLLDQRGEPVFEQVEVAPPLLQLQPELLRLLAIGGEAVLEAGRLPRVPLLLGVGVQVDNLKPQL